MPNRYRASMSAMLSIGVAWLDAGCVSSRTTGVDAGNPDAAQSSDASQQFDGGTSSDGGGVTDAGLANLLCELPDSGPIPDDAGCEGIVGLSPFAPQFGGICTVTAVGDIDGGNAQFGTFYTFTSLDGGPKLQNVNESWGLQENCLAGEIEIGSRLACGYTPACGGCGSAIVIGGWADGRDAGCPMVLP